jgi:hypothetical protein
MGQSSWRSMLSPCTLPLCLTRRRKLVNNRAGAERTWGSIDHSHGIKVSERVDEHVVVVVQALELSDQHLEVLGIQLRY